MDCFSIVCRLKFFAIFNTRWDISSFGFTILILGIWTGHPSFVFIVKPLFLLKKHRKTNIKQNMRTGMDYIFISFLLLNHKKVGMKQYVLFVNLLCHVTRSSRWCKGLCLWCWTSTMFCTISSRWTMRLSWWGAVQLVVGASTTAYGDTGKKIIIIMYCKRLCKDNQMCHWFYGNSIDLVFKICVWYINKYR